MNTALPERPTPEAASPESHPGDGRFALLTMLLAATSFVHLVSFPWWMGLPAGLVLLAATLAAFFLPSVLPAGIALFLASLTYWFILLPTVPNHIFFEMFVHLTLLCSLGTAVITRWRLSQQPRAPSIATLAYEQARPLVIAELIVMYLFTVIHKLNHDFFDPAVSCAVSMHHELAAAVPGVPDGTWTWWPTILGTLLIEGAIPLLFLARRTRPLGILIGLVFHLFLALHPHGGIYSFSNLLFVLYALLLPDNVLRGIDCTWRSRPLAGRIAAKLVVVTGFAATVTLQFMSLRRGGGFAAANAIGFTAWLPLAIWLGGTYISGLLRRGDTAEPPEVSRLGVSRPPRLAWLLPLAVFVNGASPYLDLKTTTAFSMFSNLRTEGGHNNHLFLPRLPLFGLQDDLVEVLETSDPRLAGFAASGDLMTWFEFRRIASTSRPGTVIRIRRNGREAILSREDDVPESRLAFTPHPWWLAKLLVFRPITPFDRPMTCRH